MARDPRVIVSDCATGGAIGPEQQTLGVVLCELRGENPWQTVNAAGFVMQRWVAAIAELRVIEEVTRP